MLNLDCVGERVGARFSDGRACVCGRPDAVFKCRPECVERHGEYLCWLCADAHQAFHHYAQGERFYPVLTDSPDGRAALTYAAFVAKWMRRTLSARQWEINRIAECVYNHFVFGDRLVMPPQEHGANRKAFPVSVYPIFSTLRRFDSKETLTLWARRNIADGTFRCCGERGCFRYSLARDMASCVTCKRTCCDMHDGDFAKCEVIGCNYVVCGGCKAFRLRLAPGTSGSHHCACGKMVCLQHVAQRGWRGRPSSPQLLEICSECAASLKNLCV